MKIENDTRLGRGVTTVGEVVEKMCVPYTTFELVGDKVRCDGGVK